MSASCYGLFSGEFLYPCSVRSQATGGILSIDRYQDIDFDGVQWLEIDSAFDYLNMLRDAVSLNNFIPRLNIRIDAIMLPAFQMYDDTGNVSTIFPTSIMLGIQYYFLKNGSWNVNVSTSAGTEFISDYNYMFNFIYGLFGNADWTPVENLTVGFSAGTPDFVTGYLFMEAGLRYRLNMVDLLGSAALDGNSKMLKAGLVFRVADGFAVLCGGNYTLEYNGWNVTGGIELSRFQLFSVNSRAGLSVVYNLVAGPSFTLGLSMDFDRKRENKKNSKIMDSSNTIVNDYQVSNDLKNENDRVAVVNLINNANEKFDVELLTSTFQTALVNNPNRHFSLIERSQLAKVIQEHKLQLSGITDNDAVNIGKIASVKTIIIVSISDWNGKYILNLKGLDSTTAEIRFADKLELDSKETLIDQLNVLAERFVQKYNNIK